MPMPWIYRHASKEWQAILDDLKDQMDLVSDNMAYTALDGVLQVFRKRLNAQQGLDFASVLPSVPRAIFVANWHVEKRPLAFGSRADWIVEVKAVRRNHNLTPDNAIEAVAFTMRRYVRADSFEAVLAELPDGAVEFWAVDEEKMGEAKPKIF